MIFVEYPISVQHVRGACARFNEGLRVEYKRSFDANVRGQVPKIVSWFANSQGGVLVVGIDTLNGVAQPPFEGFAAQPREEYPLTVENICLQGIDPPVLPRTHVVESDVPGRIFLVVEVDESGEAPHAIENSKKVYVRTGSAANPYDLAEVGLVIDLMRRREEPVARLERFLDSAERRSVQAVERNDPFSQVSICPTFPRNTLCDSHRAWEFLSERRLTDRRLVNPNAPEPVVRIPNGAGHLSRPNRRPFPAQYLEFNDYGFLFVARQLSPVPWADNYVDAGEVSFGDLFNPLAGLARCADAFYGVVGYRGSLRINVSVHHVRTRAMRFVPEPQPFGEELANFRCYTDRVSVTRLVFVDQIRSETAGVLTSILSELTWSFWQSHADFPMVRFERYVRDSL